MGLKNALAVGGGAVVGADFVGNMLPASLDVAGLPLRKFAGAVAGAFAGAHLTGNRPSLMGVAIRAAAALAGAELGGALVPIHFTLPVVHVDVARVAAGAGGVWLAHKFGV